MTAAAPEQPKYPNISVDLSSCQDNAEIMVGVVIKALRAAGVRESKIAAFGRATNDAEASDVLGVCMTWVDVQ